MPRTKSKRKPTSSRMSQKALGELFQHERPFQRSIETAGTGIKAFVRVKQLYHERISLGDAATAPYPYVFRLNSLYDPNETGTGHQPRGYDELAAIYNSYTVLGAKWKVEAVAAQSSDDIRVFCHVSTDSVSDIVSIQDGMERGKEVKSAYVHNLAENTMGERRILSGKVDCKQYMLDTGGSFSDQFTSGVATNPTVPVRLHIQAADEDGSAIGSGGLVCHVTIEYDAIYSTPIAAFSS